MTPAELVVTPHTEAEGMATLRAVDPRMAGQLSRAVAPLQSLRMRVQDALQPIADATPMLSHRSCRKVAVLAPRWRKLRDRKALDHLLSKLAIGDPSSGPAIDLHPEAFGADEHTETPAESPPLVDRHEPAALRGPPAPRTMPMGTPWAAGHVREGLSDTAADGHTSSSAWVPMKGGERT